MFEPSTQIFLYNNIPFDMEYKNVVDFSTGDRQAYFNSKLATYYQNILHVEKNGSVVVPLNVGELKNVNYVRYNNNNGEGDIYAFIINKKFINQGATRLDLKVDVWQTNLNNYVLKDSYVVREHSTSDGIGENIVAENFDTSEYNTLSANKMIQVTNTNKEEVNNNYHVVIFSGEILGDFGLRSFISGMPTATYVYVVSVDNFRDANDWINENGKISSILGCFLIPKQLFYTSDISYNEIWGSVSQLYGSFKKDIPYSNSNSLDEGYVPKNNKLWTAPYYFIEIENSQGNKKAFKAENFTNDTNDIVFRIYFSLSTTPSLTCVPLNYEYDNIAYSHAINESCFPQITYLTDVYKNYMALNSNSLFAKWTNTGITASVNAVANPTSLISSSQNVLSEIGNMLDMINAPDSVVGNMSAYTPFASENQFYTIRFKSLKEQALKIIDDYFTRFGYKTMLSKQPNLNSRPIFNYVELLEPNIYNVPYEDLTEFKNIFTGTTIWHNGNNYLNYSLENGVD